MDLQDGILHVQSFLAVTVGIIVLFVGKRLNARVGFLREFSIPEPVTGGLLFSILFGLLFAASGIAVDFELRARDVLLVYFFTTIGINASARDLLAGGKPLLILLAITIAFMFVQNLLFPLMGRDYDAAVVAAGFGGVSLGSTPTAMANMAAVTHRFGPSHRAFIIVPLVSAFFIDLANAMLIPFFLRSF